MNWPQTMFVGMVVLFVSGATPTVSAADERPNVVLILADDMGFSDIACFGGEIATPNLDRLAADGLRMTQVYNTSKCFPSRACLLTGAYAQQVGMAKSPAAIQHAVTLGQVLRSAGYRTLMTGKHHGTQNPFDLGFQRYFGLRDGACNYFNPGIARDGEAKPAQKRYGKRAWCIDGRTVRGYTPPSKDFYTTDAFTDRALAYLDEYQGEDNPFFLYLAYNAPHDPLQAWPQDIAKYHGKYDAGWDAIRRARYARQRELGICSDALALSPAEYGDWSQLDESERRDEARRMEVYAAMVDRLDQNVGRVVAKLKELDEFENTLIVFVSDNGGSAEVVRLGDGPIGSMTRWSSVGKSWANVSNTPFRKYKNFSHEGGISTPCIVHYPRQLLVPGRIDRTPTHFIDFMATFIEIGHAKYPKSQQGEPIVAMQGVSWLPILQGRPLMRSRPLYWEWRNGRAIRDGKWKAVVHGKQAWQLYDIGKDRSELTDLSASRPEILSRLVRLHGEWRSGS